MKRFAMPILVTAVVCGLMLIGRASGDDRPDGPPPKQDGGRGGPDGGGPGGGGRNGGPPPGGIHLIPHFVADKLNLTDDQKKQVADLEKECKDKLAKILTPEQMKTLEEARPPRRGGPDGADGGRGPGPGGQGGGPGGGGDPDGPPPRPQRQSN